MPTYLSPGVYVEELEAGSRPIEGVGTAVAAFIGVAQQGPVNTPTLVSNWTQFTQTFGEFVPNTYLAHAIYGYFANGGGNAYVCRIGMNGNGHAKRTAELTTGGEKPLAAYSVTAIEQGAGGGPPITVVVTDPGGENPPEDAFKLVVSHGGKPVEEFDRVTTKRGKQNVVTVVNRESKLIRLEELVKSGEIEKPAKGEVRLADAPLPAPETLAPDDYIGDVAARTGFGGLEAVDEITMLACPDLMAAYDQGMLDLEGVQAVQLAMIAHCELMGDRVAILDAPPSLNAQQVREWVREKANYDSKYAAMYWPWIKVTDPVTGTNIHVPPSGHMAGIWARNDEARGVHKAPANEVIRGAIAPELVLTSKEQELLNPIGVNCIRSFPGRGVRVWGARTLSSDPAWRYLNIRRLFNYLEESILEGTQWAVFEPNDHALWAKIRRTISSFLTNEWRKGALFGLTPDDAFYVKCDEETNPPEQVDAGIVACEIGVAPVKPAEFVVFRLSQFSGGSAAAE